MAGMRRIDLGRFNDLYGRCNLMYGAILCVGLGCGRRISEVLSLRRCDVIGDDCSVRDVIAFKLLKKRGKNKLSDGGVIEVSVPDFVAVALRSWLIFQQERGYENLNQLIFPVSRTRVADFFRSILGRGYGTHFMRKTFAWEIFSCYRDIGRGDLYSLEVVRRCLGHCDLKTSVDYLNFAFDELSEVQKKVFGILSV